MCHIQYFLRIFTCRSADMTLTQGVLLSFTRPLEIFLGLVPFDFKTWRHLSEAILITFDKERTRAVECIY